MSHHTKLDENIEGVDNFWAWKYKISLVLEENELDSYIHEEVPYIREYGYGKEDHCSFYQGSPYPIGVLSQDT